MFVDTPAHVPLDSKLRAIGWRVRAAPRADSADVAEQGPGFRSSARQVVLPAGTPPDIVNRLNAVMVEAMGSTAVKARLKALGLEAITSNPAKVAEYAAAERAKWGRVIKAAGIKVD
jgi:tripartite-type tricarboxylate transporter receptor subunit TctC